METKKQEPDTILYPPKGTRYRLTVTDMETGATFMTHENLTAGVLILMGEQPPGTWQAAFGDGAGIAFCIAKSPYVFTDIASKAGIANAVADAARMMREYKQPHGL